MRKIILILLAFLPVLLIGEAGNVGITYTFANSQVTTNGTTYYYEFDVMAQATAAGTRLGTGLVYINYNTSAFGEFIYNSVPANSKVTVTRGTLVSSSLLYPFRYNNNSPSRFALTYEFIGDGIENLGNELPITPTKLLHYKIVIADVSQLSGISFEMTYPSMSGNTYYDNNETWYVPVTASATLDQTLPVELSSFTAIATLQNFVRLDWVTQSETGVLGFYIYRNVIDNLNSASVVSPLVTATNTSQEVSYSFTDREIQDDGTYYYWLQNQDINGDFEFHGPISATVIHNNNDTPDIPLTTQLSMPYPNPFNPDLTIAFDLAKAERVQISIYNCRGQLVKTMLDSAKNPGHIRLVWDGKSDAGTNMPTGMYYIKMNAGRYTETMKAVLMK